MTLTIPLILAFGFILLCGVLDRLIGWGKYGRSKPVIAGVLALTGLAYLAGLQPIAACVIFGLAFMIWRTPGWDVLGGDLAPNKKQILGTFARHSLALAFVIPAVMAGLTWIQPAIAMLVFAAVATLLGLANDYFFARGKDNNGEIEFARGLTLGTAIVFGFFATF